MAYSLFLLVAVILLQGEVTAGGRAAQRAAKERELDELCLELDVDRIGGKTTAEMHSMFTSTKVKALRMGRKYREYLLKVILKEDRSTPEPAALSEICGRKDYNCDPNDIFRTADGSCNNLQHPSWGQSLTPLKRFLPSEYGDGMSSPRTKGKDKTPLESARKISTVLHTSDETSAAHQDITHMTMQFAQFLDHDITSTPIERGDEGATITCCQEDVPDDTNINVTDRHQCFPIAIPLRDRQFQRSCMNFVRSVQGANADCNLVPAEQQNQITSYMDASQVYGSTQEEQDELRMHMGGLLKTSARDLLPKNPVPECVTSSSPNFCFKAGDERVDEQMGLTSMHTIWLREHNRVAGSLADINRHWDDERLFQETRKIQGAMMQHIASVEFHPLVLSPAYLEEYNLLPARNNKYSNDYDSSVDASIRNSFATAAYRFGHSMIRSLFSYRMKNFQGRSSLQLRDSFGNTSIIHSSRGDAVNTLTRGLVTDPAQTVDRRMSPEISDFLFRDKDGNSFDLIALNIQRGRDHGLPGYNEWRKWCGLSVASNFQTRRGGLEDHPRDAAEALKQLYSSPDDIDLFSGGVSETPVPGGLIGPTFSCIVARQFRFLKVGDRFWYETKDKTVRFTAGQLRELRQTSLARIICDNTDTNRIQPNVFRQANKRNRLTPCSRIPRVDLSQWRDREVGMWAEWSRWSPCNKGKRTRTRKCMRKGRNCPGSKFEKETCGSDCAWSEWSKWGRCVKKCQYKIRTCACKSCVAGRNMKWKQCGKKNSKSKNKIRCDKLYASIRSWYW